MDHDKAASDAFDRILLDIGPSVALFDRERLDMMRRWFSLGYASGAIHTLDDVGRRMGVVLDAGEAK